MAAPLRRHMTTVSAGRLARARFSRCHGIGVNTYSQEVIKTTK